MVKLIAFLSLAFFESKREYTVLSRIGRLKLVGNQLNVSGQAINDGRKRALYFIFWQLKTIMCGWSNLYRK